MLQTCRQPLRFEPFLRPMVWGGRRIARFLGKNLPPHLPCGESWEVSDHPLHLSQLTTASMFGVTLRDIMEQSPTDLLGPAAERHAVFPWLIKWLDANDWLSVQVHPDEEAAKKLCPKESAKSEAWYILDAEPESRIYAGLKPGVGPEQLREGMTTSILLDCLHSFVPKAGDFIYIPAGTVHAFGGGILLCEIQQTSDATFRLFDWNRRDQHGQLRPLHIDQAFASIHWGRGLLNPTAVPKEKSNHRTPLVDCSYFTIDHLCATGSLQMGGSGCLQALIVTDGAGHFANGEFFMAGDVWVLPAAMPAMTLSVDSPLVGLLCTLPTG